MIPYFELRTIPLAEGVSLAVFGTLVALGMFAGVTAPVLAIGVEAIRLARGGRRDDRKPASK